VKGGDVRQQLTKELAFKEQSYERDPRLRHQRIEQDRQRSAGKRRSKNSDGILSGAGKVVQSVGEALGVVSSSTQKVASSATKSVASSAKSAQRDIVDNSNMIDWLSIGAVVVLYSIILWLLLT
jgi:hypothetical protein